MCRKQAYYRNWQGQHPRASKFERWAKAKGLGGFYPPVNIVELDDRYELHLFAPGYTKADFNVAVTDKVLTIKVDKAQEDTTNNWSRREFVANNFERQFELNKKIDAAAISAEYTDGVLKLTLAKKEGQQTDRQEIKIG